MYSFKLWSVALLALYLGVGLVAGKGITPYMRSRFRHTLPHLRDPHRLHRMDHLREDERDHYGVGEERDDPGDQHGFYTGSKGGACISDEPVDDAIDQHGFYTDFEGGAHIADESVHDVLAGGCHHHSYLELEGFSLVYSSARQT
ncbi:hypothetical protein VMCG_04017 [Cytospora schulzeri]|uniref:Uncharacterized protein n=1 Tax=Cytospora schulzeri TaxID=448051 RepID=A0A423WTD4_9PEZI|nr:hypothetical protein VMCG_04017 [Valsa malicola]